MFRVCAPGQAVVHRYPSITDLSSPFRFEGLQDDKHNWLNACETVRDGFCHEITLGCLQFSASHIAQRKHDRLRKKIVWIFPSFHPEASLVSLYKCMGWQAVCTHSVSLESQEVQAMQVVPFSREICGNGFAGHLQVNFWVIPVPAENAAASPWCLPDPGPGAQLDKCLSLRDGKNIMWCSGNCRQQFSWFSGYWILKWV